MPESSVAVPIRTPTGGERGDLPDHELDLNSLRVCQNMIRNNKGRLGIRPGYKELASSGPGGRTMGLAYYRTGGLLDRTVAGSQTGWSQFNGTSWVDISGTALTGGTDDVVRFQVFPTSGTYNLIGVNGVDGAKIWNGTAATYSNLGGSPPSAPKDIAAAANRVLLLSEPDIIDISELNNPESWDTTNRRVRLSDVGDILIGMARMGRLAVGIYGDHSQWMGRAQTGSFPFRFEKIDEKPGPVSPAAIVMDGNIHYYLAEDGNVYRCDGVSVVPIGYAMQDFVIHNLNFANRGMAHALRLDNLRIILWFFPSATASAPDLGIWFDLRNGSMGRLKYGSAITASTEWKSVVLVTWDDLTGTWDDIAATYPTWDSFPGASEKRQLLGDSSGQVHLIGWGDGSDNGAAIEAQFDLPLGEWGGPGQAFIPETFETFFRATANSTSITLALGVTDTLMSDPTFTNIETFDLSTDQRNAIDLTAIGQADGKRFVTVRHSGTVSKGGVEWMGGKLYGEPSGVQPATVGG